MIASAPSAWPSVLTLWNSEIFSSSGQPANLTPKTFFLNAATPPSAGGFFPQAMGAGILALLVAPDTVIGLIQRAGQIGSGIGQRKTLAAAQCMAGAEAIGADAVQC